MQKYGKSKLVFLEETALLYFSGRFHPREKPVLASSNFFSIDLLRKLLLVQIERLSTSKETSAESLVAISSNFEMCEMLSFWFFSTTKNFPHFLSFFTHLKCGSYFFESAFFLFSKLTISYLNFQLLLLVLFFVNFKYIIRHRC